MASIFRIKAALSLCSIKHHNIKTYRQTGVIVESIVKIGTRWPLYLREKILKFSLDRRTVGPQNRYGPLWGPPYLLFYGYWEFFLRR
jgi:hypothetical protein